MNWHGYCLIEVNPAAPAEHLQTVINVASLAGISTTTDKAHEKSLVRASLDGSKYIWEVTKTGGEPNKNYIDNGIKANTSLTQADIDNLIISLSVFDDANAVKAYLKANAAEWSIEE